MPDRIVPDDDEANARLDRLADELADSSDPQTSLLVELVGILRPMRGDLALTRQELRAQRDWSRRRVAAICVALVAIGWLGFRAQVAGNEAQDAVRSSKASTAEARVASCLQFNLQQAAIIDGDRQEIRKVVAALTAGDASKPTTSRVHLFLVDYDQTVIGTHPLRDCTPGGIAKYLQGPTTATPSSTTIPIGAP